MKICVTDDDIRNGVRFSRSSCPIAKALKRAGIDYTPNVQKTFGIINGEIYDWPAPASQFVEMFDNGLTVLPFEFETEPFEG